MITKKKINVSLEFFLIWTFCIGIFFSFFLLIKPTLLISILIICIETILCIGMWVFFMIKIEWLKDLQTGRELMHINISNILSAVRFCLIPMLIAMFGSITSDSNGNVLFLKFVIFAFMVLVCLTDLFDGMLARKLNEVTKLGMVLDPFGDFLIIISFTILLFAKGTIEWWYFVLVLIRIPMLILIMLGLLVFNIKFKIKTSFLGRLTVFYTLGFIGAATISLFFDKPDSFYNSFLLIAQIVGSLIIILSSVEKIKLLKYFLENQKELSDENIQF